jgi:hypothetical protein
LFVCVCSVFIPVLSSLSLIAIHIFYPGGRSTDSVS